MLRSLVAARRLLRGIAIVLAACAMLGCPSPKNRRNVVLISIDTLRADHLGCYGYQRPTSPTLDRLAAEGMRFDQAFSVASWTLPAHMSMLTSRYPHVHGVERDSQALREDIPTLAALLADEGVRTGAVISWFYVSARYGFDRGFDDFVELLPAREDLAAYRKAEEVVDSAIGWIEDRRADPMPFFLFVHLFDPHIDYAPPEGYAELFQGSGESRMDGRYATLEPFIKGLHAKAPRIDPDDLEAVSALYDGEIRYADDQVGRLLQALKRLDLDDETLIIVTSDHGEELDEHGSMEGHQWTLYDEVLHVPLIIRAPGGPTQKVVDELVESIDIAPTILDWMGIQSPAGFQGSSLLGPRERDDDERSLVYSKIAHFNSKQAVRRATHKLIYTFDTGTNAFGLPVQPGFELYDLSADPEEKYNRYAEDSVAATELRKALFRWLGTGRALGTSKDVEFTEEERQRLRALGYLQ